MSQTQRYMTRSVPAQLPRTGPVGRTVRVLLALALAAVVALRLATFVHRGPDGYRDTSVLRDPSAWIVTVLVAAGFIDLAARFVPGLSRLTPGARRQVAAALLATTVVVAGAVGLAAYGQVWGFPLADLWWWFVTAMLAQVAVAFAVAAGTGTPGCEQAVWQEMAGQTRFSAGGAACILGLHRLDAWEAERRQPLDER